jgi:hypothetical protein
MAPDSKEGWGVIRPGDRTAHYYVDSFSLCRGVGFYTGPLEPETGPLPGEHKVCRRLLDKRTKDAEGNK